MWTKREAEWERERLARERLMAEVQKLCVQRERHLLLCRTAGRRPIVGVDHQYTAFPDSSSVDSIWIARGGQNARSIFKGGKKKWSTSCCPSFLLPITPRAPTISSSMRDDWGRISCLSVTCLFSRLSFDFGLYSPRRFKLTTQSYFFFQIFFSDSLEINFFCTVSWNVWLS